MMPPLVDIHVHLLAGLDDGPRTADDALAMCKLMTEEGIRYAAACAHQNDDYPDNSPERIHTATNLLIDGLNAAAIPLTVYPTAEVMVSPETLEKLSRGELQSIAGAGKYILIEMPHGMCVELKWLVEELVDRNIRPILGHAERSPELLHEPGVAESLVQAGCLMQVSSKSITDPATSADAKALKSWFRRKVVHLLGSDGHSLRRRPPVMADAYRQVVKWVGPELAEIIGSRNGIAILQGRSISVPAPEPARSKWLSWLS